MNPNKSHSYFEMESAKMKPAYGVNDEYNCGVIHYGRKSFMVDLNDKDRIVNFSKKFVFIDYANEDYPSYALNYKRFTFLDFIFNYKGENVHFHFKNGDKYDLRRCNVEIYHFYHEVVSKKYDVIDYINGHYASTGQDANVMKNPLWKIVENDKEYWLMYCEKNTIVRLCQTSLDKIMEYEKYANNETKLTFFKCANGYVASSNNLYIHQIITGCYGNGKGTKTISVDHIDQNPLNNTWENLRIATRYQQEQNCNGIKEGTKRERKCGAQDLPEGITQIMMKKYVSYCKDYADKEKTIQREYFRVESHPKLDKIWSTTKSCKVSIQEKLAQANKVVDDLEKGIYPVKDVVLLPKYFSLIVMREKPHLVFEKREDGKRLNLKMVMPDDYDIDEQLLILKAKLDEKYGIAF